MTIKLRKRSSYCLECGRAFRDIPRVKDKLAPGPWEYCKRCRDAIQSRIDFSKGVTHEPFSRVSPNGAGNPRYNPTIYRLRTG